MGPNYLVQRSEGAFFVGGVVVVQTAQGGDHRFEISSCWLYRADTGAERFGHYERPHLVVKPATVNGGTPTWSGNSSSRRSAIVGGQFIASEVGIVNVHLATRVCRV